MNSFQQVPITQEVPVSVPAQMPSRPVETAQPTPVREQPTQKVYSETPKSRVASVPVQPLESDQLKQRMDYSPLDILTTIEKSTRPVISQAYQPVCISSSSRVLTPLARTYIRAYTRLRCHP